MDDHVDDGMDDQVDGKVDDGMDVTRVTGHVVERLDMAG